MPLADQRLFETLYTMLAAALLAWALFLLVRKLHGTRAGLAIGVPIAVAAVARLAATAVVSLSETLAPLRGPDELVFLARAEELAQQPVLSEASFTTLTGDLHVWLFSVQLRLAGDPTEFGMRIVQIAIAGAGLALLAAAVYDLAGPRAAAVFAWVAALEPGNVFFSGLLHKEPLVLLGEALVVLGGVRMWKEADTRAAALMLGGVAVAGAARSYAGWFLLAAAVAVTTHALMRRRARFAGRQALAAVLIVSVALVTASSISVERNLQILEESQEANTTDPYSNLPLEPVDFSSPRGIVVDLPRRIRDVVLRPYPWQVENTSQRLGVLGTMAAWALLGALVVLALRRRTDVLRLAAPVAYPLLFMTIAYSLGTGNAGTGFRYRVHVVVLAAAVVTMLVARSRRDVPPVLGTASTTLTGSRPRLVSR